MIGFMGTGKTTVSGILKKLLNRPELDVDAMIVEEQHMPVSEIFSQNGEPYFRDLESEMMEKIAEMGPAIVSCGGGAVLRERNVKVMKESGTIVLLTASPQTVYNRIRYSHDRPVLNGHMEVSYIEQLMEKRRAAYEAACDAAVITDGKTPAEVADEIVRIIHA